MNSNVIFHNPRCSKSRQTLEILKSKNINIKIKEYLKDPIDIKELKYICQYLDVSPLEIIRTNEKKFKELGLSKDDDRSDHAWMTLIQINPELLQRPIVIYDKKVAIGRPPENVLTII